MTKASGSLSLGLVAAFICGAALLTRVDPTPIIGDGLENLTAATNLLRAGVFSQSTEPIPTPKPEMKREPAWPVLAAALLRVAGLQREEVRSLASDHAVLAKSLSAALLGTSVGFACGLAGFWGTRRWVAWGLALGFGLAVLLGTPRLVNRFNNEPLALLMMICASWFLWCALRGGRRNALGLGLSLGILALTKAQFLWLAAVPLGVVLLFSRRQALLAAAAFVGLVAPWLVRNAVLFGVPAVAERGKTVAAVRLIMVSQHTPEERACMAYAFTHPEWRDAVGHLVGVMPGDFVRGGRCQRFNREICFDMGTERVTCAPFPEDIAAMATAEWSSATQLFYMVIAAQPEIESGHLRLRDIAPPTIGNGVRYVATAPLFAWRGWGFTSTPWLSLLLVAALVAAIFTPLWPFALLAASSHVFHLLLTHNLPRYHAVEIPVLIALAAVAGERIVHGLWRRMSR